MLLIFAIALFLLPFVLWRLTVFELAKPKPARWVSDDACLLVLAPLMTILFAFSAAGFVSLGVQNPTTTSLAFGASSIAAIWFSYATRKRKPRVIDAMAGVLVQGQIVPVDTMQAADSNATHTSEAKAAVREVMHAA